MYPTTLPRVVMTAFKGECDKVEVWRNEKFICTITSLREFNKLVNPRLSEDDDEAGGNGYEW